MILSRRANNNPNSFFDGLMAKYGKEEKKCTNNKKNRKKKKGKKKKTKGVNLYDVGDDEFDRIQKEMEARKQRLKKN